MLCNTTDIIMYHDNNGNAQVHLEEKKIIGIQIKNDAIIGPHDFLFITLYFERVDDGQTDRSQEREHVASRYITRFAFC